jgi:drug/metabolite transporter (DMT)-like permease
MTRGPGRLLAAFRAAPGALRGIVYMLVTSVGLAFMQAAVRVLTLELHPFEITFFRIAFGLVAFAPLLARDGLRPLRTRRLGLHVVRTLLFVAATLCYYSAIRLAPLAKVTALDFSGPLFATVLAVAFLGERIRVRRLAALAVGFAGTLAVVRPGAVELDLGTALAVAAAVIWGAAIITIKVASRTESSATITLYATLLGAPFALAAAVPYWQTPTAGQLALLFVVGILGTAANWCYAQAFREAELTVVLPFDFLRLIWAALIGYFVFAEVPHPWTWVGAVLIFSAVVYIGYREGRAREEAG